MMRRSNVVPKPKPLTETDFTAAWLVTLGRLCRAHGDATVALWLGVSLRHMRNLRSGASMPTADKIWNLLAYDASAHDELDSEYGARNVPKDALCSTDPLTRDMIGLAHETADDEAPESHGGVTVTDDELRKKDEVRLRKVHRAIGSWLTRLDEMRRPRLKAVRS